MSKSARVLILGGGFAGVECAKYLQNDTNMEVILVSESNFLLFTPMLPQVASGTIETRNIVMPIRTILKKTKFYEARIEDINPVSRKVKLWGTPERPGITLEYDYLVMALGSETNFFGMSDVANNSFQMKTLNDAISVRNRMIDILEQAENEKDTDLKRKLLTIVVVGGGFAGIETAGEIHDLLMDAEKYYPNISKDEITVIVLEAMGGILPGFADNLAEAAKKKMEESGIIIKLHTAVTAFDGNDAHVKNTKTQESDVIHTHTLIWTAGVTPVNTIKRSVFKKERGKVMVDEYLEADGHPGVFVAGDCALSLDKDGKPHAPTAQLAEAHAKNIAANIVASINNREMNKFKYVSKGQMAIIGKRTGIAAVFGMNIYGIAAWFLWRNVYLSKVPTFSKRVRVALDWMQDALFARDIARLQFSSKSGVKEYEKINEVDDFW